MRAGALSILILLACASLAPAQEQGPPPVERVYVPEERFERVLEKHPRAVILTEAELRALIEKAGEQPAPAEAEAPPPVAAAIERLRLDGRVEGDVALVRAEADVAVLASGIVRLRVPFEAVGLRWVRIDGEPARVYRTRAGSQVLLDGLAAAERPGPVVRRLTWEFAVRVTPGDERGSGSLSFALPACASGRLDLTLPGDVELTGKAGAQVLWVASSTPEQTRVQGSVGGNRGEKVTVAFRPRRSTQDVNAYTSVDARSLFLVRQGVVTLHGFASLSVYRAGRDRFRLALPEGFVVRDLTVAPGELTYVQKGSEVEVRLDTPRKGRLILNLEAERASEAGERQELGLRPLGFPDSDRVAGVLGVSSGPDSVVGFGAVKGLERADMRDLGLERAPERVRAGGTLLRVYRRDRANRAALAVTVEPVQPRVSLTIKSALALSEREVKAVTLYTYEVLAGRVYVVRARLPKGYTFEGATVADDQRRRLEHQLKETQVEGQTEIAIELDKGLEAGQGLLLTVQATDQRPGGVAGRTLDVPVFSGSPADQTQGHLGFAPDASFTLAGSKLSKLVPIPAEELPRVGVDVAGLVLGYRLEGADYGGRIAVKKKQTQVMAEILARHRVHERVIETDVRLNLDVDGAPIKTLDVQLPKGTGLLAKIEGEDLRDDRERVGETEDGQERWRLRFDRPKQGSFALNVRYAQKLEASEGQSELTAAVGRVSLGPAAFRERGTLAIYSSDSTELVPEPEGLRAIEVTEVPGALAVANERPLFAYTHVGAEHGLKLAIKRHGTQDVLTAVAEALVLETTAGPDGVSRHTATFSVKNLNNQFFALKLPKDAVLWSVVVDGEGVKPAKEGELELIPIPTAGAKGEGQITTVEAVYTVASPAWGVTGRAGLEAPVLQRSGDAVPVLHTTWKLSLPDDYRVLEWAGNVNGPPAVVASPLLGRLGAMASAAGWPLWLGLFALVGLAFGVSSTLRGFGVRALAASGNAGGGLGRAAASPGLRKACLVLAVLLFVVGGIGFCLVSTFTMSMDAGQRVESAPAGDWGGGGDAAPPTPASIEELSLAEEKEAVDSFAGSKQPLGDRAQLGAEDAANEDSFMLRKQSKAKSESRQRMRREAEKVVRDRLAKRQDAKPRRPRAVPRPSEAPPAPPKTDAPASEPPMDMDPPSLSAEPMDFDDDALGDGAPGKGGGRASGADFNDIRSRLNAQNATPDNSPAGPSGDEADSIPEPVIVDGLVSKDIAEDEDKKRPTPVQVRHSDLGTFGQVGLRSLVMELPAVGHQHAFERPGGEATLEVRFVREASLVGAAGFLALIAFLAGLVLPKSGKVSSAGLVVVGLGALTAIPVVLAGAWYTPLLNALALGMVVAAAVSAVAALGAAWKTAPLSRLARVVREARST